MIDFSNPAMAYRDNCHECARLWREYSNATNEHFRLDGKLKVAALARENERVSDLSDQVERAARHRIETRQALRSHEGADHDAS